MLVIGAGQGLGATVCRRLVADGATVLGVNVAEAPDLPGVDHRRLDVTDSAGWARLVADLERVDGLVANAGITWRARLDDLDPADLDHGQDVDVGGVLRAVRAVVPLMPAGGSIVVVGSAAALTGHYPVAYTAGTAAEIAALDAFLISDEASYTSGAEIPVDGGMTAHDGVESISDAARI